jgi:hypothetical protein
VNRDVVESIKTTLLDHCDVDHLEALHELKQDSVDAGLGIHFDGIGRINKMMVVSSLWWLFQIFSSAWFVNSACGRFGR